ncbi:MAG: tRNA pseudouridine(55) synthase TruB [Paludibacteraceae bacterium]|nr:tRNA pseudouridine(55) synthase TruB [Paludibacteraceae bacterium]
MYDADLSTFNCQLSTFNFSEGEILCIDKPLYWTSFTLVGRVRWAVSRYTGTKKVKVGHAGTLDPLATGVMIICTGKATKRIEELQAGTKEYEATLCLGAVTPSFDMEHPVSETFPTEHITRDMVESVLKRFDGEQQQVPPMFSAVKVDGRRAYKYARGGESVEIKPKTITIEHIELLDFSMPYIKIRVACSKGTYIRALARDIGVALESGAYLTELRRTRVGNISIDKCMTFRQFKEMLGQNDDDLALHDKAKQERTGKVIV